MKDTGQHVWEFVPHQHQEPLMHTGGDDHIYSPKNRNGTFKSGGLATFLGAPYCPPDRHAIRSWSPSSRRSRPPCHYSSEEKPRHPRARAGV